MISWSTSFLFRQQARESLWLVPLLGAVAGVLLTQASLWLETRVTLPEAWTYSESTASSVLATIAGAMVALISLVVTIGVLVVQMATGTLSARFMRLWYRDRVQKMALAAFTATFTFAYALLRKVETDSVPSLGVSLAGVWVTADLIILLIYLNRFVHMLRPVAVGASMANAGLALVDDWERELVPKTFDHPGRAGTEPDLRVRALRSGALQAVHAEGIVKRATQRELVCVLPHTMGSFVTTGDVLLEVYGPGSARDAHTLRGMIALGQERSLDQDPGFALRILVDIAVRALSPAVNDPTTATQMINYIGTLLRGIGTSAPTWQDAWFDAAGRARLLVATRTWEDFLHLGVNEVRSYGITSTQTVRRLRAMLADLECDVTPERRAAVVRQRSILDRMVIAAFSDFDERAFALGTDHQGIGGSSRTAGT